MSTTLSVVIITFNEERNIVRCLNAIKNIADEIIVIDSGSVDRTIEICRLYKANVFKQQWLGYSEQKNFANSKASHDWVLSLDADEAPDQTLQNALIRWKQRPNPSPAKFKRLTNYCGLFVRHGGWYPDIKVRLFNRLDATWEGVIHERLTNLIESQVELLAGDCHHYTYYTVDEHRKQSDKFTTIAAADLFQRGKKASCIKRFLNPILKFFVDYFLRLGFMDGLTGFTIAWLSACATYAKYAKLNVLSKRR